MRKKKALMHLLILHILYPRTSLLPPSPGGVGPSIIQDPLIPTSLQSSMLLLLLSLLQTNLFVPVSQYLLHSL